MLVAVNASSKPVSVDLTVPARHRAHLIDLLNPGETFTIDNGRARIEPIWPCWARILTVNKSRVKDSLTDYVEPGMRLEPTT